MFAVSVLKGTMVVPLKRVLHKTASDKKKRRGNQFWRKDFKGSCGPDPFVYRSAETLPWRLRKSLDNPEMSAGRIAPNGLVGRTTREAAETRKMAR